MTRSGRPLRFLVAVCGAWIGLRVVMLWPRIDSIPALIHAIVPPADADPALLAAVPEGPHVSQVHRVTTAPITSPPPPPSPEPKRQRDPTRLALALLALNRFGDPDPPDAPGVVPGLPRPLPHMARSSRWSGSFWLLARGGSGLSSGVLGGQLGGSQAGVRIAYALDDHRRLALSGRVTSPLGKGLREAAFGIEWQPTRLPLRIVADQRIALNGGRGGPELAVIGGIGPVAIGNGLRLDGYGQAGVIKRDLAEGYVDGALHVAHPLGSVGGIAFDLGAGAWGAAQRGARRADIGPSLGAMVPIGRQRVRIALDWRERIAGGAAPGSGLTLTLGADF